MNENELDVNGFMARLSADSKKQKIANGIGEISERGEKTYKT